KVLKEISTGELNPNETLQATLEAQLLSKLDHLAIVKFHASFVEQDDFCIFTEYFEIFKKISKMMRSLACILYEMCCMNHAFTGSNFLSIVLKIVEGDTPLPERYPRQLNAIMESMLNKSPSLRPFTIEILKIPYIAEQPQHLMCQYSEMTLEDKNLNRQKEAAYIINAAEKIHLQTLWALSEVQKMTPRERMRLRKVQAADEEARKLKKLLEEKYEENNKQMQELRSRNLQQLTVDVLHVTSHELFITFCKEFDDPASENLPESQPIPSLDLGTLGSSVEDTVADLGDHAKMSWKLAPDEGPPLLHELNSITTNMCKTVNALKMKVVKLGFGWSSQPKFAFDVFLMELLELVLPSSSVRRLGPDALQVAICQLLKWCFGSH
ncbi:hypothetical protein EI555_006513, partial [Monodon monoceros]